MFFKRKQHIDCLKSCLFQKSDQDYIRKSFARLFSSEEGERVLSYLKFITYHRSFGAEISNEQLRFMEGQRSLINHIERLIDQGRKN